VAVICTAWLTTIFALAAVTEIDRRVGPLDPLFDPVPPQPGTMESAASTIVNKTFRIGYPIPPAGDRPNRALNLSFNMHNLGKVMESMRRKLLRY
jgi:hypothetical protein